METLVGGYRDETLARAAGSDAAAFSELYTRHFHSIYSFIRAHVPNAATAEDLTSQVFFRALTSAATYRGEGSYRAWIFGIARNALATWQRESARLQVTMDDVPEQADEAASPALLTVVGEERELLWDTIDALPEAQREVIHLRYWKNLSVEEIAHVTRRSSVAVRQLLHRAKQRLRKGLRGKDLAALLGATGTSALIALGYRRHRRSAK